MIEKNVMNWLARKYKATDGLMESMRNMMDAYSKMPGIADWKDRTGTARRSLHVDLKISIGARRIYRFSVKHGVHYGKWLEEGTPPHIIRPKNKKALRFMVGGKAVFVKYVKHPGAREHPALKRTVDGCYPVIRSNLLKLWEGN